MKLRVPVRAAVGLAISGFFVWLALRDVDLAVALRELRAANVAYSIPVTAVLMVGIWLRAVRWQVLLWPLGRVSNWNAFSALTIGYAANNALPARLGEFVRVFVLHRDTRLPSAAVLGTVLIERMLDVLALLLMLALAALASGWRSPWTTPLAVLGVAAALGMVVAYLLAAGVIHRSTPGLTAMRALAERLLAGRPARLMASFIAGFRTVASARAMLPVVALSLVSWTVEAGVYYLVLRAMGIEAGGFWLAILVASVSNLAGVIPAGPGNIGAFEFFAKETLVLFGVGEERAVAYAVAAHLIVLGPPTLLGLFLAWRKGFSTLRRKPEYV